jgi:hypothetical protein
MKSALRVLGAVEEETVRKFRGLVPRIDALRLFESDSQRANLP